MPELRPTYSVKNISRYLVSTLVVLWLLYYGKTLFIPLSFGLLLAIISYPACRWLEAKGWPKGLAVAVLIGSIVLLFATLLWLLGYEANLFIYDIPPIRAKLTQFGVELRTWIDTTFGIHPSTQADLLSRLSGNVERGITNFLGSAFSATTTMLFYAILIPVFAALFLYHRKTFVRFLESVTGAQYRQKLDSILRQSITTYFKYVKGTFFVYCIVGLLNSIGLLLLGIDHAFLFGMVTAFMMIIPFVGIFISASLPVAVALITKDSVWYAVGVVAVFTVIQYLEEDLIFPKIVGQQLNLSTWAVLVAMITGTLLWGLAGMILFVPFAAILKVFSDNMEELKTINILLNRNGS